MRSSQIMEVQIAKAIVFINENSINKWKQFLSAKCICRRLQSNFIYLGLSTISCLQRQNTEVQENYFLSSHLLCVTLSKYKCFKYPVNKYLESKLQKNKKNSQFILNYHLFTSILDAWQHF